MYVDEGLCYVRLPHSISLCGLPFYYTIYKNKKGRLCAIAWWLSAGFSLLQEYNTTSFPGLLSILHWKE
jgi:hypothetical protein